jgi:hypothetical protein
MRKFHLTFSFVILSLITLGVAFGSNSPVFWLTSSDFSVQIIRVVALALVGAQLLTTPPRPYVLRTITMVVAMVAGAASFYSLTGMGSPFLDVLVFGQTAIALMVSALELKPVKFTERANAI